MQIFSLFMLFGMLVSLLVPETKGRTLEELAGEGPSLFDGEVHDDSQQIWWRRWGLLGGGKPAGWNWNRNNPNLGPKSPGLRGKRERIGIMTSPELIPKPGERRASMWGGISHRKDKGKGSSPGKERQGSQPKRSKSHGRAESENSGSLGKAYTVSVSTMGRHEQVHDEDLYASGGLAASASNPAWGVGWAVQRNNRRETVESIALQDVGSLLK